MRASALSFLPMGYNAVLDKVFSDESATEPVTLAEFKAHLNMVFDSEGSYEFNDDDGKLTRILKAARTRIEKYIGISLIERTVTAILRNDCGSIEFPFGPVTGDVTLVDKDDEAISGAVIMGLQFKWLECPRTCYAKATYTAGWAAVDVPEDLKTAIMEEGAFRYTNRGDQQQQFASADTSLCKSALELAAPYKRSGFLV